MKTTLMMRLFIAMLLGLFLLAGLSCGDDDDDDDSASPEPDDDDDEDDDTADDDDSFDDPAMDLARDLARTWADTYLPSQNAWSWDAGVMMMGFMAENGSVSLGKEFQDYAMAWIDHHLEAGFSVVSSDTSIPGFICLKLYEQTGESKYLDAAHRVWEYISEKAGRTSEGGLNHMGWISGNQIWVDTLFMVGPFLLEYADVTGNGEAYEELALQLEVFRRHLRDHDTGLYRHRYDDDTSEVLPDEPLYWGRGNGWVFVATVMANNRLPESIKENLEFDLEADLKAMAASLQGQTTEKGRFHTILNRTDTYLETSAGLLYAYGLALDARGANIFTDPISWIETWLQGAIDEIAVDDAGDTLLLGTSCGTNPGGVEYYNQVLKVENVSYGLGLFLLAAVTREDLEGKTALDPPGGNVTEEFIQPPVPCEGTACGKFHVARGNYVTALMDFEDALEADPADAEAAFYRAIVQLTRLVTDLISVLDQVYIGDLSLFDLLDWLGEEGRAAAEAISADLQITHQDETFSSIQRRILMIEAGGHAAFGEREYDLGEAYLVDGLARLVIGMTELYSFAPDLMLDLVDAPMNYEDLLSAYPGSKGFSEGIDEIAAGLDQLILGIDAIMAETDDQADDMIPRNLLMLEGTFMIPGVLPETDVKELLTGLGIPAFLLELLDMPDDLIWLLETIRDFLLGL